MKQFFKSTTVRLTVWYMLILTTLSLFFSILVFSIASNEFQRPLKRPGMINELLSNEYMEQLRYNREIAARQSLVKNLVQFNFVVITAGGIASYMLAKRTIKPIEEALEAQSRFTSDVSHELRTPLAVMQSEIEIALRDSSPTLSSRNDILKSNLDEVHNLQALTDRILALSTDKELPIESIRLDEVATEAINRVIPLAHTKNISIEPIIGTHNVYAHFDYLVDAVVILLDNAIKYSPKKSQIKLFSQKQGKHTLLIVQDSGHGISNEDLPHIFDRFYRADKSRSKTIVSGHGLGLSIAKRNIEAMHGTIDVSSILHKGSTFTIRLQTAQDS